MGREDRSVRVWSLHTLPVLSRRSSTEVHGVFSIYGISRHISMRRTSNYFGRHLKQPVEKEYELAARTGLLILQPSLHDLPKFFYRDLLESLVVAQCI
jgi:hypothetical protein